jgi:hypothetical protein
MKIIHHEPYDVARRKAMPDMGDQLDALWKLVELLSTANPALAKALKDSPEFSRIKEVKQKIPKPVTGA